ncbi:MAG: hypothetical protein J6K78_02555 [Tidjanibacter sp.]|nr:hypothetical protein [Tidjanibacter sp.]
MKATKYFALVAALLAVGCTNELMDDAINQNNNVEDGIVLTLTGDAQAEEVESRIIVDGSKSGGKYIVKWRNDDAVGIFSADGTTINNVKAAETSIESGSHTTATFATESAVAANTGDEIVVYYPHKAATTYANGKFSANVAASQQTNDFTVAYGFSAYTFAYDVATVDAEGGVKFALEHPLAYVKVQVEVTDYVKNWKVRGVQIVDRTGAAKLAGDYTIDTATGELTVTNGTPSVEQYFKNNPTGTVEETASRYMTLATLPWDFTGSEVWVVAKFEDADGNTIYVPTKYENAKLKAGAWNIIKLNLTADSQSVKSFYEPLDTRLMPGLGYAYGEQNTYLIQCKNGSTYTGGTYTPNADIPSSVKVDIRGRGDFSKIADISKATFEWFKLGVQTNGNGNRTVYVGGTSNYAGANVDATKYTIDDSTKAEGYITVTNTGAYAGSPILLMKVDNKVVWAWYFWNISADGTQLEGVDVGNGNLLANMLIGQNTTNFAAWGSNPKSTTNSLAQPAYRFVAYYQHGRYAPAAIWTSYWSIDDGVNAESKDTGDKVDGMVAGGTPVVRTDGAISLAEALARPVGIIINTADNTNQAKWCSDELMDLWGAGTNNANAAVKTVFDPCPKGWRVADYSSYNTIVNNKANTTLSSYTGAPGLVYKDVVFLATGYINGKTATNGRMNTMGGSETPTNASSAYVVEWSNFVGSATASQPKALYSKTNASTTTTDYLKIGGFNRSNAHAVRCQKDTDNR